MKLNHSELMPLRFPRTFVARWAGLLAAFVLYSATGYSAPAPRFVSRAWSVDDGLPHSRVTRTVQDPRGFLWVATAAGLARFDGVSFTDFPTPHHNAASVANIRDMVVLNDGTLLVL